MSNFEPGNLLHKRYRITRPLSKGGMGMVYLADDLTLRKVVAVKENFSLGEDSSRQFLQEAHLLASLHHPNLPRVTDYFIEEPHQYLIMDYLPGDDLQTILEREGCQPTPIVLAWADQLADALFYMHSQTPPVIHRDIKPANIKLKADGTAVLVDFGIAKAAETSQKTAAGAMGFTPGFAPPEQAGGGRTGPFSDQFALSATLYNLLTGTRPVDSVKRVLDGGELPPARMLKPDIAENVSDAMQKAMALHPEDRFESVQTFLTALHDSSFRWSASNLRGTRPPEFNERKPAWFYPAMGLIGLLVIAILGVSVVAMFKLAAGKVASTGTASVKSVTTIQPTRVETITPSDTGNQISTSQATALPVDTVEPESTQALVAGGKWLVYSSNQADGDTLQLWLMQIGLNNQGKPMAISTRQLTYDTGDKIQAAWAPDGKSVLFTAPAADGDKSNGLDIWQISVEGGVSKDLTNRKGDDIFPAWSPDGTTICFTNKEREDSIRQIYTMDASGENQLRISTDYEESQGIWSKNMQSLFYVRTVNQNDYFFQRPKNNEYKTTRQYDKNQVYGRFGQVTDPAFSSDGTLLAFTRTKGRDRRIGIADYSSEGAVFSLITKTGLDYDPTWSTDGKWVAFTSERDGLPQIYIMTSAGLIQTGVSPKTATESYPAWQP